MWRVQKRVMSGRSQSNRLKMMEQHHNSSLKSPMSPSVKLNRRKKVTKTMTRTWSTLKTTTRSGRMMTSLYRSRTQLTSSKCKLHHLSNQMSTRRIWERESPKLSKEMVWWYQPNPPNRLIIRMISQHMNRPILEPLNLLAASKRIRQTTSWGVNAQARVNGRKIFRTRSISSMMELKRVMLMMMQSLGHNRAWQISRI